jgi:hypothetical protein
MTEAEEDRCLEKLANLCEAVLEEALAREAKASMRCVVPSNCSLNGQGEAGGRGVYRGTAGEGSKVDLFLFQINTP